VKQDPSLLTDYAQVHGPRVQIDLAVVLVRQLVQVHRPPPHCSLAGVLSALRPPRGEGACMRIKEMKLTSVERIERSQPIPRVFGGLPEGVRE
jgi:hypothetical protein